MAESNDNFVAVIGDPGVGKSTLLNGLVGEARFRSGFSPGGGLTQQVQSVEHDGVTYIDSPGLHDINSLQAAGCEIAEALRRNGAYRIILVVTLEAGRVLPSQLATIKIVLDSIDGDVAYGVVVNKTSPAAVAAFADEDLRSILIDSLAMDGHHTEHVFINPFNPDLFDASDQVPELSPEFHAFVDGLPVSYIDSAAVSDLKTDEVAEAEAQLKAKLKAAEDAAAARQANLRQQIAAEAARKPKRSVPDKIVHETFVRPAKQVNKFFKKTFGW